jgi:hypothetical protein
MYRQSSFVMDRRLRKFSSMLETGSSIKKKNEHQTLVKNQFQIRLQKKKAPNKILSSPLDIFIGFCIFII